MRGRNNKTVFIFKNKQIKLVKFAIFCGAQDTLTNPNKQKYSEFHDVCSCYHTSNLVTMCKHY